MKLYLGIDTSNYTTSIAAVDELGNVVMDARQLLAVEQGKRGLRQSDALFLHIKNLPKLLESLPKSGEICAVGASCAPRRTEDSYMPVFLAGMVSAQSAAAALRVPLLSFSHQEGHIRAGLLGLKQDMPQEFYAVHLSGGTTEILSVSCENKRYRCEILGGTQDISAGQLIDRVGVKLGLIFPCGKELEQMSLKALDCIKWKTSVKGTSISFTGVEAQAMRAIEAGTNPDVLARSVLSAVARSLVLSFRALFAQHGEKPLLLAGGVASNRWIRSELLASFGSLICFSQPQYATDNAVGIAFLTKDFME